MNTKKLKFRGFSLFVSVIASLILMGVSVAIIVSINRFLGQTNNIGRSNQAFFALEAGREAALFHHSVRGAGMKWKQATNNPALNFNKIGNGATVTWGIDGRTDSNTLEGNFRENEKVTIPLYWDNTNYATEATSVTDMTATERKGLELSFPDNPQLKSDYNDQVAIVWSVSRKNSAGKYETWIPSSSDPANPCANGSTYFCGTDLCNNSSSSCSGSTHWTNGIIDFGDNKSGLVLPGNTTTDLKSFMNDATSSNYEISFQPVLPFTDNNDQPFPTLNFKLTGTGNGLKIPRNTYTIISKVDLGDFEKTETTNLKEKPSIGAFDYLIFK